MPETQPGQEQARTTRRPLLVRPLPSLLKPTPFSQRLALVICLAISGGLFLLDVATPAALAPEMLYGAALVGSLWTRRPVSVALGLASLNTMLIPLAHALIPLDIPLWMDVANRSFSALMLWIATGLVLAVHGTLSALRTQGGELTAVNASLRDDIRRRDEAETALNRAEQRYRLLFETMHQGVVYQDAEGRVIAANPSAEHILGKSRDEIHGRTSTDLEGDTVREDGSRFPGIQHPSMLALRTGEDVRDVVMGVYNPREKAHRWITVTAVPLSPPGETVPNQVYAIFSDITERKRVEEQLRLALAHEQAALATNQTLLNEIHHRVKNNMQMLCDMLYLQMESMEDEAKAALVRDIYGRIFAMARLHEQLYQSMQEGRIDLGEYLSELIAGFGNVYPHGSVCLDMVTPGLSLDLDRAVHLGLIVNELLTNALKHAFPDGREGFMGARVERIGEELELRVWDTGVGVPATVTSGRSESLGLRIVDILAKRLKAAVTVKNDAGTTFLVRMPLRDEQ